MNFGVQLYSVRNEIKELGLEKVFEIIKNAGYDSVEFAGFYNLSPKEMKNLLEKYDLKGISAHIRYDQIEENLPYIDELDIKSVYIPCIPIDELSEEKIDETIEKIKKVQPLLEKRNIVFGYHNHHREYLEGRDIVYELITKLNNFTSQLDIFWAVAGGKDPLELMDKYGKNLSCIHVKEMDKRTTTDPCEYPNVVVGEGKSKSREVIKKAIDMGITTFILEVEGFSTQFSEYLTKSCKNMKEFTKQN